MIVLGLGSNLGDRAQHLQTAVHALKAILTSVRCSPVYESPALLPAGAPPEWNISFLNMAVCGNSMLSPQALLTAIKTIEQTMGRTKQGHWGPREIDIDILAMGTIVLASADLTIPHAHLAARDFALVPFADILPHWKHPSLGASAQELAATCNSTLHRTDIIIV